MKTQLFTFDGLKKAWQDYDIAAKYDLIPLAVV